MNSAQHSSTSKFGYQAKYRVNEAIERDEPSEKDSNSGNNTNFYPVQSAYDMKEQFSNKQNRNINILNNNNVNMTDNAKKTNNSNNLGKNNNNDRNVNGNRIYQQTKHEPNSLPDSMIPQFHKTTTLMSQVSHLNVPTIQYANTLTNDFKRVTQELLQATPDMSDDIYNSMLDDRKYLEKDMIALQSDIVNGDFGDNIINFGNTYGKGKSSRQEKQQINDARMYTKIQESGFNQRIIKDSIDARDYYNRTSKSVEESESFSMGTTETHLMSRNPVTKFNKWFDAFCAISYVNDETEYRKLHIRDIRSIMDEEKSSWELWCHRKLIWYKTQYINAFNGNNLVKSKLCLNENYEQCLDDMGRQRSVFKTIAYIPSRNKIICLGKWIDHISDIFMKGHVIQIGSGSDTINDFIGMIICLTLIRISCGSLDTSMISEGLILLSKLKYLENIIVLSLMVSDVPGLSLYLNVINIVTFISNSMLKVRFNSEASGIVSLEMATIVGLCYMSTVSQLKGKDTGSTRIIDIIFKFYGDENIVNFMTINSLVIPSGVIESKLTNLCHFMGVQPCNSLHKFLLTTEWMSYARRNLSRFETNRGKKHIVKVTSLISVLIPYGILSTEINRIMPIKSQQLEIHGLNHDMDHMLKTISFKVIIGEGDYCLDDLVEIAIHYYDYSMKSEEKEKLMAISHIKGLDRDQKLDILCRKSVPVVIKKSIIPPISGDLRILYTAKDLLNNINWDADYEDNYIASNKQILTTTKK